MMERFRKAFTWRSHVWTRERSLHCPCYLKCHHQSLGFCFGNSNIFVGIAAIVFGELWGLLKVMWHFYKCNLSTPVTQKFSEDCENGCVRYGLSSMQGWRATMEDAILHSSLTQIQMSAHQP